MNKMKNIKRFYVSPDSRRERVVMESTVCAGSEVTKIKSTKENVEVDEWDPIQNGVTFD